MDNTTTIVLVFWVNAWHFVGISRDTIVCSNEVSTISKVIKRNPYDPTLSAYPIYGIRGCRIANGNVLNPSVIVASKSILFTRIIMYVDIMGWIYVSVGYDKIVSTI